MAILVYPEIAELYNDLTQEERRAKWYPHWTGTFYNPGECAACFHGHSHTGEEHIKHVAWTRAGMDWTNSREVARRKEYSRHIAEYVIPDIPECWVKQSAE